MSLLQATHQDPHRLLVGSWIDVPGDPQRPSRAISTYWPNGLVFFTGYEDAECKKPVVRATGTWRIEGKLLALKVTLSSNAQRLPVGTRTYDAIAGVSGQRLLLVSPDGVIQERHRALSCAE